MARSPKAERLLIIDDDVMSRDVLTLLLQAEGFVVESVASGDAALPHLQASASPGIILSDLHMPGLSGATLGHALRRLCPKKTVLLAMSGSPPSQAAREAFDAFLLKPFRVADFCAATNACRATKVVRPKSRTTLERAPRKSSVASNNPMSTYTQESLSPPSATAWASPSQPANEELDERIYRQLNEAMPRIQLRQLYLLCVEDVRSRITVMRSLAAHREAEQFVRHAHAIKGGCGMLGATELYIMASQLEKEGFACVGLDHPSGLNRLDELAAACDRLERTLGTRI